MARRKPRRTSNVKSFFSVFFASAFASSRLRGRFPGMRLRDKIIIVTGSTQGVGEGIARRFVAEGAKVVLHGLERELGERVLADLRPNAVLCPNDLSKPESAQELVDAALKSFGGLHAIVNNAATT